MIVCTRVASTAMPGAGVRAPTLEAAGHEVLRVREVGADEADLHFGGGPEAAADVGIWRVISGDFQSVGGESLTGKVVWVYLIEGGDTDYAGCANTARVQQSGQDEAREAGAMQRLTNPPDRRGTLVQFFV